MAIFFEELDVTEGNKPIFHCVSEDLRYGKGLAKQIKEKFGNMDLVAAQCSMVGQVAVTRVGNRVIFHLVSKKFYHGKPTMASLAKCLSELKKKALIMNISCMQAPKFLSCGLDRLSWRAVLTLVKDVFQDSGIDIYFCSLPRIPRLKH